MSGLKYETDYRSGGGGGGGRVEEGGGGVFCFQPLSLAHRLWFTDNIVNDDVELFIVVPFESGSFKSCSLYFLSFLFSFGEGGWQGK